MHLPSLESTKIKINLNLPVY